MSVGKNLLVEGKQWLMRGGSSASLSLGFRKAKQSGALATAALLGRETGGSTGKSRLAVLLRLRLDVLGSGRWWPGAMRMACLWSAGRIFFQSATPASGVCRWLCNPGRKELPHKVRYHSGECSAVGSNVRPHRSSFLLLVTVDGRVTEECPFDKAKNPTSERWITRLASR